MPAAFVPHRHGYAMVIACQVVYWSGWAQYNWIFLPRLREELEMVWAPGVSATTVVGVIFNVVFFLAVWSFMRTHCSDPGGITEEWRCFVRENHLKIHEPRFAWQPAQATWCSKCEDIRPERAHHCSSTNKCVLRFDHYCPWTANSIGALNHKFFVLVAFYTFLSNLIAATTMLPVAVHIVIEWLGGDPNPTAWPNAVVIILAAMLASALTWLYGDMCRDHLSKACHNITSVEVNYTNMRNPYDLGNNRLNLSEVFGDFGPDWFIPVLPQRPRSDGISFERRCEKKRVDERKQLVHDADTLLYFRYASLGLASDASTEEVSSCGSGNSSEGTDD